MARKTKSKSTAQNVKDAPARRNLINAARVGKKELIIAGLLVGITVLAYSAVFGFQFVNFDDDLYITNNPVFAQGLTAANIKWAFTSFYADNWHPVTWLSLLFDRQLFGFNAGGYHATNLILHCANVALLFFLLHHVTGKLWESALVSALLAWHPLHVESVAWVIERKDVLSTFFLLLTLAFYYRFSVRRDALNYILMLLMFALGLMSKQILVTLPFAMLLLDYWPLGLLRWHSEAGIADFARQLWPRILEKIPLLVLSVIASLLTISAAQHETGLTSVTNLPLSARLANALVAYVRYLIKMIAPKGLSVFYPYNPELPHWQVLGALLVLAIITVLVVRQFAQRPYLVTGWFWYLGTLVPVIGIVQAGRQAIADRFTYVPLLGISVMIAWGLSELIAPAPRRRRYAKMLAAAVLPFFVFTTAIQVGSWRNSVTLFTRAVEVDPNNAVAHHNLGFALQEQGQIDEALKHFSASVWLDPDLYQGQYNYARTLALAGRNEEAVQHYQRAIELKPDYAEPHYGLAVAFWQLNRFSDAQIHFQAALRLGIKSDFAAQANNYLGIALAQQGQPQASEKYFQEAIRLAPDNADAYNNLGTAQMQIGKIADAITNFTRAVQLKPNFTQAQNNLANAQKQMQ